MSTILSTKPTEKAPVPSPSQASDVPKLDLATADGTTDLYVDEEASKTGEGQGRQTAFANLSKRKALRLFWRPIMYCSVALFGVMMDGFQIGLPGSIVANRGFINKFGTVTNERTGLTALDPAHFSYWALATFSFAFGVQFLNGHISDRYGRRSVRWGMTGSLVVGLFIEMFAQNWWQWLLSKICMGIGQGMCQHGVLTYLGEMAPTAIRGSVIASYAWGWCFGQLFAACTLYAVNSLTPLTYLNAIYAEWIPLGLWIIFLPFLPESPWYYARKNLHDKAKKTMSALYKGVEGFDVEYEYLVMQDRIAEESEKSVANKQVRWSDIAKGTNLRRTIAGIFCVNQQALSGMNVIMGQTTYFFQQIGLPEPFQANVIVYCMSMIGIIGSLYTIERFGRRKLIITSTSILLVLNVCVASLDFAEDSGPIQQATLGLICIWVFIYACGLSSTCWAAPAECPTLRLRAKTMSAILMTNSLSNVLYSSTIPLMISAEGRSGAVGWGRRTLFLFVCLGSIGLVGNWYFLPETRGRSYYELDEMYEAGIPPRQMSKYHTEIEKSGQKKHLE